MAGWSKSQDGLELKKIEIDQAHERYNLLCLDPDFGANGGVFDDCKGRVKCLFDQVIPIYLREVGHLPALFGDGRPVDLFRLFWVVKKRGGFDVVSKDSLWGVVAAECGLSVGVVASVKLIYAKYLMGLDGWLEQVLRDKRSDNGEILIFEKLDLLIAEMEELKVLVQNKKRNDNKVELKNICIDIGKIEAHLSDGVDIHNGHNNGESIKDDSKVELKFNKFEFYIDLDVDESELVSSDGADFNKGRDNLEISNDDEKAVCFQGDKNIVSSAKSVVNKVINSQKSKLCSGAKGDKVQDNLATSGDAEKLHSKSVVQKSEFCLPDNVVGTNDDGKKLTERDIQLTARNFVGKFVNAQKSEVNLWASGEINEMPQKVENEDENLHVQDGENIILSAFLANVRKRNRESTSLSDKAHLMKNPIDADSEESSLQKKLKMHPSLYEDKNTLHQSTERVRCRDRFPLISPSKLTSPCKEEMENESKILAPMTVDLPNASTPDDSGGTKPFVKQVSIGPLFQAEVPEWTGVIAESDSKWLGKRVWSPEDGKNKSKIIIEEHTIGKGRQNSCNCPFPGSAGCVRFHIAENRIKLKVELGKLFYCWRFDRMGEEVSLSWTTKEEKRFKSMVQENSAGLNKFWKNAFKLFPTRTREKLVSYYFNVLVLRRRCYQNRVTPKDIDSDEDEEEFGSVGDSAYYEGNHVLGYKLPICSLNLQCTDLE